MSNPNPENKPKDKTFNTIGTKALFSIGKYEFDATLTTIALGFFVASVISKTWILLPIIAGLLAFAIQRKNG